MTPMVTFYHIKCSQINGGNGFAPNLTGELILFPSSHSWVRKGRGIANEQGTKGAYCAINLLTLTATTGQITARQFTHIK